jgi:hypothetical protein
MRASLSKTAWLKASAFGLALAALQAGVIREVQAADPAAITLVAPGMNQTEVQSILGPPDYIQVNGLRQAWQFCPRRFRIRLLEEMMRREDDLFVTVWFDNGRAKHMRAYPSRNMGLCEDYLAAFRWEDEINTIGGGGGFK